MTGPTKLILIACTTALACNANPPTSTTYVTSASTAATPQRAPDDRTAAPVPSSPTAGITWEDNIGPVRPIYQSQLPADVATTEAMIESVVADKSLSADAKRVEISTSAGVLTLRGPVATDEEKRVLESKALALPGVIRVDDELESRSPDQQPR